MRSAVPARSAGAVRVGTAREAVSPTNAVAGAFAHPAPSRPKLIELSSQINLDHPLVCRDLVDGALGDHGALMQHRHLDAKFAHEGHVVLDHNDGAMTV